MKRPFCRLSLSFAVALLVTACSSTDDDVAYVERPVEEIYNEAHNALLAGENQQAAEKFDEVERQHPYSVWATKSQLMAAYANYEIEKYDEAIIALDRFIQLHPTNKDVPYALYLKGLSYYEQISDVGRDQLMTQEAQKSFSDLIKRFPDSKYAKDARLKLDLTFDHLAGKEMEIGRYYTSRNQCIAALSRFKTVVQEFDTTTHVPEALHRMIECYTQLGLDEEAQRTAAVLGHNFPGSEWYLDSYQIVERKRLRPREEANWYWPFENEDTLDNLQAEGATVRDESDAFNKAETEVELPGKKKSWWEFW